jgi:D-lyxose ketol-isomerase
VTQIVRQFDQDRCHRIQPVNTYKVWGREELIINDPLGYCGKRLIVKPHAASSIHFHRSKTETFYVNKGILRLALFTRDFTFDNVLGGIRCHCLLEKHEEPADAFLRQPELFFLVEGDILRIPPFFPHCFWNIDDALAIFTEFSTPDSPNDSYRLRNSIAKFAGEQPDLSF